MEIVVTRTQKNPVSTIGKLAIVGSPFNCLTLEGKDRGLTKSMTLQMISDIKVKDHTAIPTGRYEVTINFSNRFQRLMPLVLDVPGYGGIRIHPGNDDADTDGCLLLGYTQLNADFIQNSKQAFADFFMLLQQAVAKKERVFITIVG
jgi:hypothetical protein